MKHRTIAVSLALGAFAAATAAATVVGVASARRRGVTVHLAASRTKLRFSTKVIHVKPGAVTLVMSNPSRKQHSIGVDGRGIQSEGRIASRGRTSKVTVTLRKGRYTFYCPVDDHRDAGMVGKIIVR